MSTSRSRVLSCPALSDLFPEDGASAAFYRTAIAFTIDGPSGEEQITLCGPDGEVSGSTEIVDDQVSFVPDAPLAPESVYAVTLDWCGGLDTTTWTTSTAGPPVPPSDAVDRAYALDLGSGRFVAPDGLGPLVQALLNVDLLLGVSTATDTELTWTGAVGQSGVQDSCSSAIDLPVADFSGNPYFALGPATVPVSVRGYDADLASLVLTGAFSPDGSALQGVALQGVLDTRQLAGWNEEEDGAFCSAVQTFGAQCEPCPDGSAACLAVYIDDMTASALPGVTLVPISAAEVAGDPSCY